MLRILYAVGLLVALVQIPVGAQCCFAEGSLLPSRRANGNSYAPRARVSAPSWSHRVVVHNEGSRSEYEIGHLGWSGVEIDPVVGHLVTPIGEFQYVRGTENSWKPAESPGWVKNEQVSARTTSGAGQAAVAFTEEEGARGWYLGGFDARRRSTPRDWFFMPGIKAWADPGSSDDYERLIVGFHRLKRIVAAVEEFRERVGDTPGNLELLVTGPRGRRDWAPIVRRDELKDPWGGMYEIENFARLHARTEGRDFAVRSKGPDGVFGSGDDLDLPEPVNPRPSPFEGLLDD